jgi:hypothetical protein
MYNIYQPIPMYSSTVTVPANFVGVHWFGWPNYSTGNTPQPTNINYKSTYTWDWVGWGLSLNNWNLIETSVGTYNWTAIDTYMAAQGAAGKTVCYSSALMPSFYSQNPNTTGSPPPPAGPFGWAGPLTTTGSPSGLTALNTFITTVINRYISKGTPIKVWQAWQEPLFSGQFTEANLPVTTSQGSPSTLLTMTNTTGIVAGMGIYHAKIPNGTYVVSLVANTSVTISQASSSAVLTTDGNIRFSKAAEYWWGSAAQLVDMANVTYTAVKAADPTITVLSTSAEMPLPGVSSWWNTAGSTYPGVLGYQTCDQYGIDCFGYWPTNFQMGFDPYQPTYLGDAVNPTYPNISGLIAAIKTQMGANVKPIYVTSWGFSFVGTGPTSQAFRAYTPLQRKQFIARSLLEFAANGVQAVIIYGGDSNTYLGGGNVQLWSGDFVNDTNGVIAGINEFAANVPGKTILWAGVRGDGQMLARFTDGSIYVV